MNIILVNAPASDVHARHAGALLQQALSVLCGRQGHKLVVLPGNELPGRLHFFERRKQQQAIRRLQPGLVIYCSPKNLLPVKGLRTMVLATTPDVVIRSQQVGVITDSAYIKKQFDQRTCVIELLDEEVNAPIDAQGIRNEFTLGKEYFLYTGDVNAGGQWEKVLQAFSQFKKWQQSGLQLVLAGNIDPNFKRIFHEKLDAYKYRNDIIIQNNSRQLAAAAFSVISTAFFFTERMHIIHAFHAGVPVIAHDAEISKALCGDSALYADLKDPRSLSQQMISVYKNEAMYNHLSEKGRLAGSRFGGEQMLAQLNDCLRAAANNFSNFAGS